MDQAVHCSTATAGANATVFEAKRKLAGQFRRRGMAVATMSGVAYGVYTAFMTLAMTMGVWAVWYGENSGLSDFAKMFLLGALGAATTDTCSAIWALLIAGFKGKLGDFARSIGGFNLQVQHPQG